MRPLTRVQPRSSSPRSPVRGVVLGLCASLLVVAGCDEEETCGAGPATPSCPLASSRAACVEAGGCWEPQGYTASLGCTCATADGGKPCTASSECEAGCLHDSAVFGQCAATAGTCAASRTTFGCYCLEADGHWDWVCVD